MEEMQKIEMQERSKEVEENAKKALDNYHSEQSDNEVYELLAGYIDEQGAIHKEFEIRDMTGADEEMIADIKKRGETNKVISSLLCNLIIRIGDFYKKELSKKEWKNIIDSLLISDQDYILIKIRENSIGDEMSIVNSCPYCNKKLKTDLLIEELEVIPYKGERVFNFELVKGFKDVRGNVHKSGKIRMPNGEDRDCLTKLYSKNQAKAETLLLTRITEFEGKPPITESTFRNLSIKDRKILTKILSENIFGIKTYIDVDCPTCGETFRGVLNAVNFI